MNEGLQHDTIKIDEAGDDLPILNDDCWKHIYAEVNVKFAAWEKRRGIRRPSYRELKNAGVRAQIEVGKLIKLCS
jgi:isopentenyl diphosphate isomerase/L-lactate dehydrogenase-like FMN-dependent dehydrogenase